MYQYIENSIKEIEMIQKNQIEILKLKIIIPKMKNPNLRLKNKFALAEGKKISELEDRSSEIIQFETGKKNKRRKKNYQKFRDM